VGRRGRRFYVRGGNGWGVSVGIIGAILIGIALATTVFWLAVIVVAILVLAGVECAMRGLWQQLRRPLTKDWSAPLPAVGSGALQSVEEPSQTVSCRPSY